MSLPDRHRYRRTSPVFPGLRFAFLGAGLIAVLAGAFLMPSRWQMTLHAQDSASVPVSADQPVSAGSANSAGNGDAKPSATGIAAPAKGIPTDPLGVWHALGIYFNIPLALTSFVSLWVCLERLVVLRRGRVIPRHFVTRFFDAMEAGKLDPRSALKLCEENGSPIAFILAHGVRKWGKPSVEVEQGIIDGGERQISHLRKNIRVLNGAATVAPLVGLLGTVVGMIQSFNDIAVKAAMGRTDELATGIGLALLTTAVGLTIAIPSLIMYMYLAGRVDGLIVDMDLIAQDLVDYISAEALAEHAKTGARPSGRKSAQFA